MPPKLTSQERLNLLKRVVEGKEPVAQVCREAGISRVLFYRWLNRYKSLGRDLVATGACTLSKDAQEQVRLRALTPQMRSAGVKPPVKPPELSPDRRLEMIERVKAREPVAKVCRDFGISRTIFYRWHKRYEAAPEGQKLETLRDKKPKIERYWHQTPEKYEKAVLNVVIEHPELSTHKIVEFLPQIGGQPILGNHGVQNVLRRHNLTTYEQRFVYSQALRHPVVIDRFVHAFQNLFYFLYTLPVRARILAIRFTLSFALGAFLGVIILGISGLWETLQAVPFYTQAGLIFALLALATGSIFFLYALRYYFMVTLVLGFSRQVSSLPPSTDESEKNFSGSFSYSPNGKLGSGAGGNNKRSFWQKLLGGSGFEIKRNGGNSEVAYGGGLEPDISGVELQRNPFVSIHLPMYNEKRVVDRLLTACTSLAYENYEVIVADDSTDETVEILKNWADHPKVKIIHRKTREGYKGGALKEALRITDPRAEFILIFDSDFLPYPDTITQFLKYFQATAGTLRFADAHSGQALDFQSRNSKLEARNSKQIQNSNDPNSKEFSISNLEFSASSRVAAVQGYQWHVLNKSENWVTRGVRSEYAGSYVVERSAREILGALKQIAGSVYMIRRDVLDKCGWGTSLTEDFELTLKLYNEGYKVVYTPYIQTPSECVSVLGRLVRQRMRWAEGHSYSIKKLFWPMITSSRLTLSEKLELVYLFPYYLQAALFLFGTFSWILAEAVFSAQLPFWTSLWGWSLVLTNLCALPLMNMIGLFLEESEERDYMGILSFLILSYLLAPFQGYAAVKGFLERQEGPWFRTPKTGKITDIFTPGRFYRFITGIFGRPSPAAAAAPVGQKATSNFLKRSEHFAVFDRGRTSLHPSPYTLNPILSLATANNRFNGFRVKPKRLRWVSKAVLALFLCLNISFLSLTRNVLIVQASPSSKTLYIQDDTSTITGSDRLTETSSGVCDTGQGPKHAKLTDFILCEPDTVNNSTPNLVKPDTNCPATASGTGWFFETPFETWGYLDGDFTFKVYISDNQSANTGFMKYCLYKVAISGSSITSSTLLKELNGGNDIWTGAAKTITDSFTDPCGAGCTFDSTQKYLFIDFWADSDNGAGSSAASISFGNNQCGTAGNYPQLTIASFLIPEKVVFFLAVVPFIPMVVLWMRRRNQEVGIMNYE